MGIVGPIGAGKDTAADYLGRKYGFVKFNTSDVIREELRKEGVSDFTREDMQRKSKELRDAHGKRDILTERTLYKIMDSGEDLALILGVRLVDGIEYLRKMLGAEFYLLAIEADQRKRFKRKQNSKRSDDSDLQVWKDFVKKDAMEMFGNNENSQEVGKVVELADETVLNAGSLEELYGKLDKIIRKVG